MNLAVRKNSDASFRKVELKIASEFLNNKGGPTIRFSFSVWICEQFSPAKSDSLPSGVSTIDSRINAGTTGRAVVFGAVLKAQHWLQSVGTVNKLETSVSTEMSNYLINLP